MAQALEEGLTILTSDSDIPKYDAPVIGDKMAFAPSACHTSRNVRRIGCELFFVHPMQQTRFVSDTGSTEPRHLTNGISHLPRRSRSDPGRRHFFSTTGNVVFANVAASRKLAEALNRARKDGARGADARAMPLARSSPWA